MYCGKCGNICLGDSNDFTEDGHDIPLVGVPARLHGRGGAVAGVDEPSGRSGKCFTCDTKNFMRRTLCRDCGKCFELFNNERPSRVDRRSMASPPCSDQVRGNDRRDCEAGVCPGWSDPGLGAQAHHAESAQATVLTAGANRDSAVVRVKLAQATKEKADEAAKKAEEAAAAAKQEEKAETKLRVANLRLDQVIFERTESERSARLTIWFVAGSVR